jgi:hypothetical protein
MEIIGFEFVPEFFPNWAKVREMILLRGVKVGNFEGQFLHLFHIKKTGPKRVWSWQLPRR